jgi:hypothetical protein
MEVFHVTWFPGPFRKIIVEPVKPPAPTKVDEPPEAPEPTEPSPAEEPVEVPA